MQPSFNPHVGALAYAATNFAEVLGSGELPRGEDGSASLSHFAAQRADVFMRAVAEFNESEQRAFNPFLEYRQHILGGYSTAERLAALVLHLFNSRHPVDLSSLLANADHEHRAIALHLMAHYARYGENDPIFMGLARQILRRNHPELFANDEETTA